MLSFSKLMNIVLIHRRVGQNIGFSNKNSTMDGLKNKVAINSVNFSISDY